MCTTETNKLIAEFMAGGAVETHHNQYHNNWNELMAVVEKIEELNEGIYQVDILQEGCKINIRCAIIDCTVAKLTVNTTKIQAVYKAVVEFIKWYNKNQD